MHVGRLVFPQIINHLPMRMFRRCVARYENSRYGEDISQRLTPAKPACAENNPL